MQSANIKGKRRPCAAFIACAVTLTLVAALVPLSKASAYCGSGTAGACVDSLTLNVQAGSSVQMSIAVNSSSDSATPGYGMGKRSQMCTSDGVIAAGYARFDVDGQRTGAVTSRSAYSSEDPKVSVQSSNSDVATAYVSGDTLVVTGHSAGSATITVSAPSSQWQSDSATVQVNVSEPANEPGVIAVDLQGSVGQDDVPSWMIPAVGGTAVLVVAMACTAVISGCQKVAAAGETA